MLNYVQSSLGDGEVAALGTTMTRLTAKALMYLVLAPTTHQLPSHTPLRRAGIDLIGLNKRFFTKETGCFSLTCNTFCHRFLQCQGWARDSLPE
jgi:hypothetical protein